MNKTAIEPLLTTADVAAILKCSQDHIVSLYHAGKLPAAEMTVVTPPAGRPGRACSGSGPRTCATSSTLRQPRPRPRQRKA